ncbi:hypothetical protein [Allostreptomyces psammosilenae]|uniref:Acyl carrier protein n=1 Tax=Allostreptomyces psammosilenae TaxID=1892865 RepID=A0A853A8U6_9ACTN|nr:hypothetical protein [Allostreptomyces psammosilenae]NYI06948.1 acyl carrier protein [Allostreptomyces psammosilenae]
MPETDGAEEITLRSRVRAAVAAVLRVTLDPERDAEPLAALFEQYDSLAVLDTVGEVERVFGVAVDLVDDDPRTSFASVAAIADLVRRKQADDAVLGGGF